MHDIATRPGFESPINTHVAMQPLHGERREVEAVANALSPNSIGVVDRSPDGQSFTVPAAVEVMGNNFAIVHAFNPNSNTSYLGVGGLIAQEDGSRKLDPNHMAMVRPGERLVVGREQADGVTGIEKLMPGVTLKQSVSPRHFSVELTTDGRLIIGDESALGSSVAAYESLPERQPEEWERSSRVGSVAAKADIIALSQTNEAAGGVGEFDLAGVHYSYAGMEGQGTLVFDSIGTDGKPRRFAVYESRSGGSARVSQGKEWHDDERTKKAWLKGSGLSADSQYSQDTQLHPAFAAEVNRLKNMPDLSKRAKAPLFESTTEANAAVRDFERQTAKLPLGNAETDEALKAFPATGYLDKAHVNEALGLGVHTTEAQRETALHRAVERLNQTIRGVVPDFSQPARRTESEHPQLGKVTSEMFQKIMPDGRTLEWHMSHDGLGRAWIERIRFADAQPTAYGTDDMLPYSGILTSKPLEYMEQADGLAAGDVRKLDPANRYADKYVDITPFLARILPVNQYLRKLSQRGVSTAGLGQVR